jgi:DNA-binding XRE family transcriptional regulator
MMTIMLIVCGASEKLEYLKPQHVRAARALLDWTQTDLARRANVVRRTIVAVETGNARCQPRKIQAVLAAFEAAGVDFVFGTDGVVALVDGSSRPKASTELEGLRHDGCGSDDRTSVNGRRSLLTVRVNGRRRTAG